MLLLRRRLKVPTFCTSRHTILPRAPFSSLSSVQPQKSPIPGEPIPKPSSLSARLNFVFEQIDAIEKERSQKDETLQRIRAWRESKKQSPKEITPDLVETTVLEKKIQEYELVKKDENAENVGLLNGKREVELVHPWPEWIGLMERLVQQNYFDHKRKDEEGMIENLGFSLPEMVEEEGFDFTRDFKTVQTAVLNFGRDRFDIMRSLSRQDLQILVGHGCPSADKKVVFSSKLLRKHVHLDEGDVCSSCSLRSTCERAYLLTNKEDEARTIDVMRVLLTYGFDTVNGSVTNKSLLKLKSRKNVVRKLIHEVVKLSAVPIDPNLPPPVIKRPPPKVKQPPPPPKKRVGRDDIEMKKGDWLCTKCDFMNFAKNTVCLQCDAKRPKRQLLPGEWECPQCNFLNYRRNTVCFHCEHKRPPEEFAEAPVQERQQSPRRVEKLSGEISNAWNFDFDDNESDGADVAAFEYADSKMMKEDLTLDKQTHGGIARGREDGFYKDSRQPPRLSEKESSDTGLSKPRLGFDDFDDEDDDLDSYEVDTRHEVQKASTVSLSELEVDSFSEDDDTTNNDWNVHQKSNIRTLNKKSDLFSEDEDKITHGRNARQHPSYRPQTKQAQSRRQAGFSGSDTEIDFGSDDDLPIHPKQKSSQVNKRSKGRGPMSYGSADELSSDSDYTDKDDFRTKQKKGNKWSSNGASRKQQRFNFDDETFSDEESRNDGRFNRKSFSSGKAGLHGKGKASDRGMDRRKNPTRDSLPRSSRGKSFERGGGGGGDGSSRRMNPSYGHSKNFSSPRREGSYRQRQDRNGNSSKHGDSYLDDERFQRPRLNVR